jgi:uncharacterized membrane protein YedE/YeeE
MSEPGVLSSKIKDGYKTLFYEQWPPIIGGILLALFSILMVAWSRPWGIVGGIRNWADWLFYGIGVYAWKPPHPLFFSPSVMDIGLLLGCFASALMAKEFAFRMPPGIEMVKGLAGGLLMGVGSALAIGCNVGAFYTPLVNLSANGFPMLVGLIAGSYFGLRYLLWELEKLPPKSVGFTASKGASSKFDWKTIQPYAGALVFIGLIAAAYAYSSFAYTEAGVFLLLTAGIGVVLQRCRFCFVRAFRDPFMTGEAAIAKAVVISIIIASVGVAMLKWTGLRSESSYVVPTFWWGSLVGGVIFGFGMVIAGGCGSGTLWRVAEGQLKLWITLFTFATTNSLMTTLFRSTGFRAKLGAAVFLPEYLGWGGSLFLIAAILIVWYAVVVWNEETNKFTVGL